MSAAITIVVDNKDAVLLVVWTGATVCYKRPPALPLIVVISSPRELILLPVGAPPLWQSDPLPLVLPNILTPEVEFHRLISIVHVPNVLRSSSLSLMQVIRLLAGIIHRCMTSPLLQLISYRCSINHQLSTLQMISASPALVHLCTIHTKRPERLAFVCLSQPCLTKGLFCHHCRNQDHATEEHEVVMLDQLTEEVRTCFFKQTVPNTLHKYSRTIE